MESGKENPMRKLLGDQSTSQPSAEPPVPSGLSVKSDWSMEKPPEFRAAPPSDTLPSAEPPVPSGLSVKSDWSMEKHPEFRAAPPSDTLTVSPVPSGLSVKSDWSMERPPEFRAEPPSDNLGMSPDPRHLSLKRDGSKMNSPGLNCEPAPSETAKKRRHNEDSEVILESCCLYDYKQILQKRCESVTEGMDRGAPQAPLNSIYTELYITEGQRPETKAQHEVIWLETVTGEDAMQDSVIKCSDIFKAFTEEQKALRLVLTSGVAGVGKTFSVLKFCLDWTQGSENQDLDLVLLLSFRELNLARGGRYSLLELIHVFHPSLRTLSAQTLLHRKVLLIFDGLDESRLPLNFSCEVISEVTQQSEVNILLVNLINGKLLPAALLWITSRPAAANQIPSWYVHRVTEVRGFVTDAQKEQYFTKRFSDQQQCDTVLSHIRGSHSLHTMCQIPVFCWIIATVLDHMMSSEQQDTLPQSLTDLYAHFLMGQSWRKRLKYPQGSEKQGQPGTELPADDRTLLLRLGRLAFEQLEAGNLLFYEEDLKHVGLNVTDAVVQAGVCSEIFKRDCVLCDTPIYCFIHLSVQEFLAAVYLIHTYTESNILKWILGNDGQPPTISTFLRKVMKKCLKSKTGHLDLVARFLHGLCLESNFKVLKGLLGQLEIDKETKEKVINNLKEMNVAQVSADRSINLIHCLIELRYNVQEEIQVLLKAQRKFTKLSDIQCSALAYMLQSSEEVIEEFDMRSYSVSQQGKERLVPCVRNCRKAVLDCRPSDVNAKIVESALSCDPSNLRELELMSLQDSGLTILCSGLQSPNCRLQALRLRWDQGSESILTPLVSALKSNPSHLRELSLMYIHSLESYMGQLCEFLQSPDCCLETLRYIRCSLTQMSCSVLASALKCNSTHMKELDLSQNNLDSGVEHLCGFLRSPDCRLKILRLGDCGLSESSCSSLASALKSNPSHLRQLDLSGNRGIKDSGLEHLCGFLQSPDCRLETLGVNSCSLSLASALKSNHFSNLRQLDLSENSDIKDSGLEHLCEFLQSRDCRLETLRVKSCSLSESSCSSLASALKSTRSHLRKLDLSANSDIKDSGVEHLCGFLKSQDCRLETLRLSCCSLSDPSCSSLASALKSNRSRLRELDLSKNTDIQDSGVEHLCGFLQSSGCRLEKLRLNSCKISRSTFTSIKTILKSASSSLKELSLTVDGSPLSDENDLDRIGKCHLDITFIPPAYYNDESDYDDQDDDEDYLKDAYDQDYDDDRDYNEDYDEDDNEDCDEDEDKDYDEDEYGNYDDGEDEDEDGDYDDGEDEDEDDEYDDSEDYI